MGETIIEKIIRHNTGKAVKPGDIVTVNVDRVMIHDIFIPFVAEKFEEMGFQKLWDSDKVVLIYDHLVPASQQDDTRHFHVGDAFAAKYGMKNVHRSDGICHQLMTEAGYVKPGNIVFGTDSHTTTYGCVGAFFFRHRLHRDGQHLGNRNHVDQGSGNHKGCDRRRTSGECHVQGYHPPPDR